MWSLKFKIRNLDSIYTVLTNEYNIVDYFYPLDYYWKNDKIHILSIHYLEGEDKEKKKFVKALKNHPKTEKFEMDGDIVVVLMTEEEKFYELIYNQTLHHPSPTVISKGYEDWHVSSWDRDVLEKLMGSLEKLKDKFPEFELKNLSKTNLKEIYFPKIVPEMPQRQKEAFHLAASKGYYRYPRKSELRGLAKEMSVSPSTFHEHLRRAESKLLPFFINKVKF